MTTLVWFRRDLRIADNPALAAAARDGAVIPLYIFAPEEDAPWRPGAASRWWLHQSLGALDQDLRRLGSRLIVRHAQDSLSELLAIARDTGATRILWNRLYEPATVARDRLIKATLRGSGIGAESFNASLLREPWEIANQAGKPFQVFTAFWRHCLALPDPPEPQPAPALLPAPAKWPPSLQISQLELPPRIDWAASMRAEWSPGERAATAQLDTFLGEAFEAYAQQRNRPDRTGTSRLSPHLHFGEIGPRQIWHATQDHARAPHLGAAWRDSQFLAELGWREFGHHLLHHFPRTAHEPLRERFEAFPWRRSADELRAWQRGRTGYPIVDAGMRELWKTGWMHNRVRMITASFLIKDLLQPWQDGAAWFWDTLVDADLAANTLGWQWVAGCGADAAPYFRIFNPSTQGRKFDPDGAYIRRFLPELERMPSEWIHEPWRAPAAVRQAAGLKIDADYPAPIVDHGQARERALRALAVVTESGKKRPPG
ncbi:MAG: deoxyribodipyrimidine photo-lyase [Steroidobacteraceae bacterium]|nr:deoxyribodipyrimidine photo-lyase [Steroidobacteraceae bacterium]